MAQHRELQLCQGQSQWYQTQFRTVASESYYLPRKFDFNCEATIFAFLCIALNLSLPSGKVALSWWTSLVVTPSTILQNVFFGHCSHYAAPLSFTNTGLDTFFSFISFPASITSTTSSTSRPQPGYLPFTYCNLFNHLPWLPCASTRYWNQLFSKTLSSQ